MTHEYRDKLIRERGDDDLGSLTSEEWAKIWEEALSEQAGRTVKVGASKMDDATYERYMELLRIVHPINNDEPWTPETLAKRQAASREMLQIVQGLGDKK